MYVVDQCIVACQLQVISKSRVIMTIVLFNQSSRRLLGYPVMGCVILASHGLRYSSFIYVLLKELSQLKSE